MENLYDKIEDLYSDEKDKEAINLIESVDYEEDGKLLLLYSEILLNPSKGKPKKKLVKKGILLLEKAMELGMEDAAYELGQIYAYYDEYVEEDLAKAEKYWIKGVELGSILSTNELLALYEDSKFNNFDRQIELSKILIEDDTLMGIGYKSLGRIYLNPNFKEHNIQEGIRYYETACEKGKFSACMKLMEIYYLGVAVPKDLSKSLRYCLKGKEKDDGKFSTEIDFWINKLTRESEL